MIKSLIVAFALFSQELVYNELGGTATVKTEFVKVFATRAEAESLAQFMVVPHIIREVEVVG